MAKANNGHELIIDLFSTYFFTSVLCVSGAKVYYRDYMYKIMFLANAQGFAMSTLDSRSSVHRARMQL